MTDRDPFDKDFGFDEPVEYWPIERPQRKFSLRDHWVVWLILINCVSFFVILFLYSGGHPIEFIKETAKQIYLYHHEPTEEELLLEDAQRIRTALSFAKGDDVKYTVHRYMDDVMWDVYYEYGEIMNARGNSLIQLPSGYYYLSEDRKRLYLCYVEEKVRKLPKNLKESIRVYSSPETAEGSQRPADDGIQRGEIYQAPDGTWKNY